MDGVISLIEVLDTAGQEEYTALRDQWIRDGEGFLLVYSIASRNTFERIRKFVDQIQRVKDLDLDSVPMLLVGNKCDKLLEREVSMADGVALAQVLRCEFMETSAKTSQNVEAAFYGCVRRIRQAKGEVPRDPAMQPQILPEQSNSPGPDTSNSATLQGGPVRQKKDKKCVIM